MADVFTSTSVLSNQVVAAYDRRAFMALRDEAVFKQYARVKPANQTSPGSSVSFLFWDDLTEATTPLSETVDVDAVGLSDSLVTVTPQEHGNSVLVTIKVRNQTFSLGFDSEVADIVAYNMVDSVEHLAEIALTAGGTAVVHPDATASTDIVAADTLDMNLVRRQVAALKKASVRPSSGQNYDAILHPDVSYDLMIDTTAGAWLDLKYTDASPLRIGQIGTLAGVNFIESPRAKIAADGGSSTVDVYTTYILGAEAFGMAEDIPLHIQPGPVTDRLMRFMPLGWYGLFAFKVIRSAALRRVLTSSSIGSN